MSVRCQEEKSVCDVDQIISSDIVSQKISFHLDEYFTVCLCYLLHRVSINNTNCSYIKANTDAAQQMIWWCSLFESGPVL